MDRARRHGIPWLISKQDEHGRKLLCRNRSLLADPSSRYPPLHSVQRDTLEDHKRDTMEFRVQVGGFGGATLDF